MLRLKKGGFPVSPHGPRLGCELHREVMLCTRNDRHQYHPGDHFCENPTVTGPGDFVIYVSLEELIEACGDKLRVLEHQTLLSGWFVFSDEGFEGYGATPTEAVSTLWLKLHEK